MSIEYVNGNTGTDDAEATTIAASAINAAAGNAIIVYASSWFESGPIAVSGVADTAGNSYNRLGSAYIDGSFLVECWLAQNIAGNASNVVTATFASSTTYRRIHVLQFSGVALSNANDTAFAPAGNVDSTSPYTPTAANTAVDGEMIIGFATYQESGVTYSSSAPSVLRLQNDAIATFTNLIASAGSGSASVAGSVSGAHWCYSKSIKPAAGATTISISDAGAGADAIAQLAAALALSDAGAGADGFSGQAALAVADSAAGADGIGSPTVILQLADTGAGADLVQFVQALLQAADSGVGLDGLSIAANLFVADTCAGLDTAAAYVLIQIADAGSTADAVAQIAAALSIADAGGGIDALAQILAALLLPDSGAGLDSISVGQGGDVKIIYDAATGADSLGIVVQLALADSAAAADLVAQLQAALAVSDSGAGMDAASIAGRLSSIVDSGMGADLVGGVSVSLTLADAGAAADMVAQVLARLSVSDAGMGADVATAITFLAHGKIRITFTARRPGATITAKRPSIVITAKKPGITFH